MRVRRLDIVVCKKKTLFVSSIMGSAEEDSKNNDANSEDGSSAKAKEGYSKKKHSSYTIYLTCLGVAAFGASLLVENAIQKAPHEKELNSNYRYKYSVFSETTDVDDKNGVLKHVHKVLERRGYQHTPIDTPWALLWSHDYPFRVLRPNMLSLKPYQRVNHFPGIGFITSKVHLATSDLKHIPKAFKLPENKEEFKEYAKRNQHAMFVQKDNHHRGVYLKNVTEIDVESGRSFVQEYVQKPFLVDGHKFDIGVYVVLTAVNPLRAYWYKGDVLFRYCPEKYHPFSASNRDKYVVRDDYRPTWQVPALERAYTRLGFGMKDSFDIYVRSVGKDPSLVWEGVREAIVEVLLDKEKNIIQSLISYQSQENFFEMVRFDLMVDEDLRVHLLEVNMSPNLSSAHFAPNQMLYEQILNNLFSITGIAAADSLESADLREKQAARDMVSAQKNIAVFGEECMSCAMCDARAECALCAGCLRDDLRASLLNAHTEFTRRGDFRRLLPPPMRPNERTDPPKNLSEANKLLHLWYQGKCNMDITWCS